MCESNAYVRRGEAEELLLQEVVIVEPAEGGYRLRSLFGEETLVQGRLEEVNLLKHKILFSEEG
ncbi:MAG: CooT family nickel-binding protein [Deltaproteobacteria bacterium]|nr:CooT family nickel-binding protein [Deltaproteobacteria bacterium]